MSKLEKLTKEQEKLIPVIRDKWINIFNNNTTFNEKKVVEGFEWLYDFCKLKKPRVFIMDNPFYVQVLANMLKKNNVGNNVRDNVGDNVWDNVWDNVRDNVGDNVWNNVRDNVGDNVWDNVWDNVRDNVWDNVRDNVRDNVGDNSLEYERTCDYLDYSNSGWVSFCDYFTEIGVLNNDDFNIYRDLISQGIYYTIVLDGVCIVSRPPKKVKQNEFGQPHCLDGFAIDFNGYGINMINGKNIKPKYFNAIKSKDLKVEDFLKEKNEEQKSACIEMMQLLYGDEYLVNFLEDLFKEVDTYVDKKSEEYLKGTTGGMNVGVYTLFKGELNRETVKYVRCYCPSTDRMFFLGVDDSVQNAKDAIASLYRVPRKLKDNIKHISRQGERFCTVFEEGTNPKALSKKDLNDLVSIDGNKYFELIKYEY